MDHVFFHDGFRRHCFKKRYLLTRSIAELVNLEVELAGQQSLNWRTMFPSMDLCSITCIR